ncbi:hypothetical protein [Fodinicola feengrottensis]|uniref:Uncharacterized protein n=1 Tax=Fodinicola feengrottensis TaxID=435914 RepID=A0ABN2JCN2_9ACTN|nr:hypothetical protein [Fodinicola feengrottensis]
MGIFDRLRARRIPAQAQTLVDPHERVVAWGRTEEGTLVVATTQGLWPPAEPRRRLGWHEIHKAGWAEGVLTVIPSDEIDPGVVADGPPLHIRLTDPGDLPPEVRTRVTRSVAYSAHHQLATGGVWVVGRRVPMVDGLAWAARYDAGTDYKDPAVRAQVADLIDAAARSAAPPQP